MLYLIVGAGSEVPRVLVFQLLFVRSPFGSSGIGCGSSSCLQFRTAGQHILVCDTHENNHAYTNIQYLHITGVDSCTFPKLADRPQLEEQQSSLPSNTQVVRRKTRNRRARDVRAILPGQSLSSKTQLRPHCCCRVKAGCLFWPSSSRHGWEPTSPQSRPHNSPNRHHLRHLNSRPSNPRSMSRNTHPKSNSAAQQSSSVCLLPGLASSPSQP